MTACKHPKLFHFELAERITWCSNCGAVRCRGRVERLRGPRVWNLPARPSELQQERWRRELALRG